MTLSVSDVAFTPRVKSVQERLGSRAGYASMEERGGWKSEITSDLKRLIAERWLAASVSAPRTPPPR